MLINIKDKKAVTANTDTVKIGRKGGRSGMAKVYTVVQGELKDIKFKTGISDGKFTEVLGDELKEGALVVVSDSQSTTAKDAKAQPMRGL